MVARADALIESLSVRETKVMELLRGEMAITNWDMIKDASLIVDLEGKITSNNLLKNFMGSTRPILEQFSEDLVAIRTKVTMIVSKLTEEEDESMFYNDYSGEDSVAMKFVTIIQVIQSMADWSSAVFDNWINYHKNRAVLKTGIDVLSLLKDKDYCKKDDMCQSLMMLDCKMAKELKSILNTTLFHYVTLEDIVLDATGSVMDTPQTPGYSRLYV